MLSRSEGPHTQNESCRDCGWGQGHKISMSRWAQPGRQPASTQQRLNECEAQACVGPGGGASPQGKQMAPATRPSQNACAHGTLIARSGAEVCRSNVGDPLASCFCRSGSGHTRQQFQAEASWQLHRCLTPRRRCLRLAPSDWGWTLRGPCMLKTKPPPAPHWWFLKSTRLW